MDAINDAEWPELTRRLTSGKETLQELTARYVQTRAAAIAAQKAKSDPMKNSKEWEEGAADFEALTWFYLSASDSRAAVLAIGAWEDLGESIGEHLLDLGDQWEKSGPAGKRELRQSVEHIQTALDRAYRKPQTERGMELEADVKRALEESGWRAPRSKREEGGAQMDAKRATTGARSASIGSARSLPIIRPLPIEDAKAAERKSGRNNKRRTGD